MSWSLLGAAWDGMRAALLGGAGRVTGMPTRRRHIEAAEIPARLCEQIPCGETRCNIAAPLGAEESSVIGLLRKISKLLAVSQLPGSAVKSSSFSLLTAHGQASCSLPRAQHARCVRSQEGSGESKRLGCD